MGDETMEHQAGKGYEMQAGHGFRQVFVVFGQAPEARRPGERTLHHSAPRQEHEAVPSFGQLDHLQPEPVLGRISGRLLPGRALIDKVQFHRLSGCFLHARRQGCHLLPI
jgi:hypothetical protein